MYQSVSQSDHAPDPLIEAVIALSGTDGPENLTARRIAEQAGTSASTINYKYASIEDLKSAAWAIADERLARAWTAATTDLNSLTLSQSDLGPVLFTTLRQILIEHRGGYAMLRDVLLQNLRDGRVFETPHVHLAEQAYFAHLAAKLGHSADQALILQAFCGALQFGYLLHVTPTEFDAWALALIQRFCDRFSGAAPTTSDDSALRLKAEAASAAFEDVSVSNHATSATLLASACKISLEQGAGALTHRAVARDAGLSVSSVQHFFGSRASLLSAVYLSVLQNLKDRALTADFPPGSLTGDELVEAILPSTPNAPVLSAKDTMPLLGLLQSASYRKETRVIAQGYLANFGQSSLALLESIKNFRGHISRLDGQIFSLCNMHFSIMDLCESGGRASKIDRQAFTKHLIIALFI